MYAIIETGGKQFWVIPGETIRVEKLEAKTGEELTLNALWAAGDAKEGQEAPTSQKAKVKVEVLRQTRDGKILVFQRKPKKAYKTMQGHRQWVTDIRIKEISLN